MVRYLVHRYGTPGGTEEMFPLRRTVAALTRSRSLVGRVPLVRFREIEVERSTRTLLGPQGASSGNLPVERGVDESANGRRTVVEDLPESQYCCDFPEQRRFVGSDYLWYNVAKFEGRGILRVAKRIREMLIDRNLICKPTCKHHHHEFRHAGGTGLPPG